MKSIKEKDINFRDLSAGSLIVPPEDDSWFFLMKSPGERDAKVKLLQLDDTNSYLDNEAPWFLVDYPEEEKVYKSKHLRPTLVVRANLCFKKGSIMDGAVVVSKEWASAPNAVCEVDVPVRYAGVTDDMAIAIEFDNKVLKKLVDERIYRFDIITKIRLHIE